MKPGMKLDDISEDLLLDCSALVKANSIQGCKKNHVYVVYTRWKNLKKTGDMVDGQVGFHRPDNVRRTRVEKNNPVVRQIEKTKQELYPDLAQQQQDREREIQRQKRNEFKRLAHEKQQAKAAALQEKYDVSYDRIHMDHADTMKSNKDVVATEDDTAAEAYEDDFF